MAIRNRCVARLPVVGLMILCSGLTVDLIKAQQIEVAEVVQTLVTLDVKGTERPDLSGSLKLVSAMGKRDPIIVQVEGASPIMIRLPASTTWQVTADINSYWFAGGVVTAGKEGTPSAATLELWPTGMISGIARPAAKEERIPQHLSLKFRSPRHFQFLTPQGGRAREEDVPESVVECPLDSVGSFSCEVPATTLDLALRAKGYISHYRWDVKVPRGETLTLGTLSFRRGASLVGWVEVDEGAIAEGGCTAHLLPRIAAGGGDPMVAAQIRNMGTDRKVQGNGFFHFDGIAPGTYVLEVEQAGFAPATMFPVEIWPDSETSLRDSLVLKRPLTLEIAVSPAKDAVGKAWDVRIFRASDFSAGFDSAPIYDAKADGEGLVRIPDQAPGTFYISVGDSLGNSVYSDHEVVVETPSDARIDIEVTMLTLNGELSFGGEALAGTLWFGGRHGAVRFQMTANDDGEFEGFLTRGGSWVVDVETEEPRVETQVLVEVEPDDAGEARVRIRLPDTEVFGFVVDPKGRGVEGARVSGLANGEVSFSTQSEVGGEFTLRGFEEGVLSIGARLWTQDGPLKSDNIVTPIQESVPYGPIELHLRATKTITGTVTSSRGPVVGAVVGISTWRPPEAYFGDVGRTDSAGTFTARISESAQILQATVSPPGHALGSFLFTADEEPRFEVASEGGDLEVILAENRMPVLFQGNLALDYHYLFDWARGHGIRPYSEEDRVIRLPRMAPGTYRACPREKRALAQASLAGDWQNGLDESLCVDGYLAAGSTLRLDLTATESAAP